jgi:hypothetical protein
VEHEPKTVKTAQDRDHLTANTLQSSTLRLDIRAVDIDVARDGGFQFHDGDRQTPGIDAIRNWFIRVRCVAVAMHRRESCRINCARFGGFH